jgi:hypothetical protein
VSSAVLPLPTPPVEVMDPIANQRRFRSGNAETTVLDFMSKGEFERIHERFYMEDLNEIVKLVFCSY